jgi:hypothetical protein
MVFVKEVVMRMGVESSEVAVGGCSCGIEAEVYVSPHAVKKDCSSRWLP